MKKPSRFSRNKTVGGRNCCQMDCESSQSPLAVEGATQVSEGTENEKPLLGNY